ncbi:Sulfite reductase [NADPH] hemoprotein beta-component [Providencia rettgeri]|nr:Sulfite reductase [NADPH] hemoprotein beta-component [Providencia rettgeri]
MSNEQQQKPLIVEGKLADSERMKQDSNYLRGTIKDDLKNGLTGDLRVIISC